MGKRFNWGLFFGALQIQASICLSPRSQAASLVCAYLSSFWIFGPWPLSSLLSTDAGRQTWPSFPTWVINRAVHEVLVQNPDYRLWSLWNSLKESHCCWEGVSDPVDGRAGRVGLGRMTLHRSCNPALLNGSLHPLLCLHAISLKPLKEQYIKGILKKHYCF